MVNFSRLFCCSSPSPHLDPHACSSSSSRRPRGPQMIFSRNSSHNSSKNESSKQDGVIPILRKKNSSKEKLKDSSNEEGYRSEFAAEKNKHELSAMREQLEALRRKVLDKDEFAKATEVSRNQMNHIQTQLDELKCYATEKDSLINDAKEKLAKKQAKVEKLQWEAKASKQKVEGLEEELDSMQSHISALMTIFEGLSNNESVTPTGDFEFTPFSVETLPDIDDDDGMNEVEMYKMEEARKDYVAAVALAKEKRDEASLAAAARARLHLQSFVFPDDDDY